MAKKANIIRRPSGFITHTTVRIAGTQDTRIDAQFARTPEAFVTLVWGGIILRFLSAAAVATVLEGFASARALLLDVDNTAPAPATGEGTEYAVPSIALSFAWPTPFAAVHRSAYSKSQRRTVHWVDLHMGPVTWQILDHTGYHAAIEALRQAHRTAVATCPDGGKWRADPTRDDYKRPE